MYCHGMDTDSPEEYLTLPAGSDNNYASFHKERLKDFHNCDGPTDPSPTVTAKYWGTTKYVLRYILARRDQLDHASSIDFNLKMSVDYYWNYFRFQN